VNSHDGFTIAFRKISSSRALPEHGVSETLQIWFPFLISSSTGERGHPELFERYGLSLNEWEKDRTDRVKITEVPAWRDRCGSGMSHLSLSASVGLRTRFLWLVTLRPPLGAAQRADLGALLWFTYGVLINASPVIVANVLVFSAAA